LTDEQISEKKLFRFNGVLHLKLYKRAKRMDYNFTPYWKLPVNAIFKKPKVFESAKLLDHQEEEGQN
jgi:hypothetical protein